MFEGVKKPSEESWHSDGGPWGSWLGPESLTILMMCSVDYMKIKIVEVHDLCWNPWSYLNFISWSFKFSFPGSVRSYNQYTKISAQSGVFKGCHFHF